MSTAKRRGWTGGVIGSGLVFVVGSLLLLAFTDDGSVTLLAMAFTLLIVDLLIPER